MRRLKLLVLALVSFNSLLPAVGKMRGGLGVALLELTLVVFAKVR